MHAQQKENGRLEGTLQPREGQVDATIYKGIGCYQERNGQGADENHQLNH